MIRRLLFLLIAITGLSLSGSAFPHSMPQSAVNLDIGSAAVRVDCTLPMGELELALPGLSIGADRRLAEAQRRSLIDYAARHIWVEEPDGERWVLGEASVTLELGGEHRDVRYRAVYVRPHSKNSGSLRLRYDAITHQVMSHVALVYIRGDFSASRLEREPELVGMLQNPADSLTLATGSKPARGLFGSAITLGVRHILKGYDHILFLLSLIVVLPLAWSSHGWSGRKPLRQTIVALVKVVTAFTIGHSVTLLLAVLLDWSLPAALVEMCVAATVLAAAINIWKPVFAHKEAVIAGLFGLVHGMAFSGALGLHLLDPAQKFEVVLGFNLGVEVVQLLLAAALIAPVWSAVPFLWFGGVRACATILLGSAAAYWLIERIAVVPSELSDIATLSETGKLVAVALLATAAMTAYWIAYARKRMSVTGKS